MSKKPKNPGRSATTAAASRATAPTRRFILMAMAGGILIAAALAWAAFAPSGAASREAEMAALQRPHAATSGNPGARVHIVEFLDPACETCRQFYPYVKGMMRDNPGNIRLSVRLVAFHPNSEVAVKALEAAKAQGKFWAVLDGLLGAQPRWVIQHRVDVDRLWKELATLDLDIDRLKRDMESASVAQNIATDLRDAGTMKVKATPEYFVNGRGLPEFGLDELQRLVGEELRATRR